MESSVTKMFTDALYSWVTYACVQRLYLTGQHLGMNCSKAIQVFSFGGPEVLQLREVPIPSVSKGQVSVRNVLCSCYFELDSER